MITIIAEKPSVARDIAKIVGASSSKDGYLEGAGYYVTYAFGHLVGLAEPTAYGYNEKWIKSELPLLPNTFQLTANKDAKKQLGIIKNLFKSSDSIVVATDAGREGELIFRWIYEYLNEKKPFKRLWISDMTDKSIQQGMSNLLEGKSKDNLYLSAKARAESDWLIGLNTTRLMTINNKTLISIGRVQTPTLRIIVDRYLDNTKFESSNYWKPFITIDNNVSNQKIKLVCDKEFNSEEKAKEFISLINHTKQTVIKREDKKEKENAPKLYSLTSLQKEANAKLNFTADQTLKTLQGLYETHKLTTYPRTDSEHLTDNQTEDVIKTLNSHKNYFSTSNYTVNDINSNSAFNNAKVTDHHAVIPTHIFPSEQVLAKLSENEKNLYNMIITRFYQRFSPACEKDKILLSTFLNNEEFKISQITETFKGWKIYNQEKKEEEEIPFKIQNGQNKDILEHSYSKFQTQPKPIHNEATLLSAMEMAGKEIENNELKDQMKGRGLGTPATRSGIIEILISRKYIERKGKQLIPTETGIDLIGNIKNNKISIPEWTAEQEFQLSKVESGELDYSKYIQNIKEITKVILSDLEEVRIKSNTAETKETLGQCPKCNKGMVTENNKAFGCNQYKEGCDFVIWKEIAKKKLSTSNVKALLTNGKSPLIKGFTSKTGKKFDAILGLTKEFKIEFLFNK